MRSGVTVYAYRDFDRGTGGEPAGRSGPTPADGTFSLELPAGSWILVAARTGDRSLRELGTGDLFCYFGGNTVRVEPGTSAVVGLGLSPVGDDPGADNSYGISGTVHDERGKPHPEAVVSIYKSPADGFKGMPGVFVRTQADGTFRMRVRKGTFFVVARKRETGELFGPTRPGDRFGYYPRNPVVLADGERRGFRVDALPRWTSGKSTGKGTRPPTKSSRGCAPWIPGGNPLPGIRVLAYRTGAMTGFPAFVSGKTGADGSVELAVAEEGTYYLLARERLGGPADGEWYGRYAGSGDHGAKLSRGMAGGLTIVLEKR